MTLRDDLLAIDGVGEATTDAVLDVVEDRLGEEIDLAHHELTREGGGGKAARIERARSYIEAAREDLGGAEGGEQ